MPSLLLACTVSTANSRAVPVGHRAAAMSNVCHEEIEHATVASNPFGHSTDIIGKRKTRPVTKLARSFPGGQMRLPAI